MHQPPDPHQPPTGPPAGAPPFAPPTGPPGVPPPSGPPGGGFGPPPPDPQAAAPTGWAPQPSAGHGPAPVVPAPLVPAGGGFAPPGRGGRAGILTALFVAVFSIVVANEWVLRFLIENVRRRSLQPFVGALFFAHWSAVPASEGDRFGRDVLTRGFWIDNDGARLFQALSLGDDELVHWLFNFVRIGLLVVAVAITVAITLSRHQGGVLARWITAWGAIAVAAALSGAVSSAAFEAVNNDGLIPVTTAMLAGAGFGGLWAFAVGWVLAVPAALVSRPRR